MIVLFVIVVIVFVSIGASLVNSDKPRIEDKSVLVIDLSEIYPEQKAAANISNVLNSEKTNAPGLFDVVRMLEYAKTDQYIKGIYLKANSNPNGYASSEELRNALLNFRQSGKFVIAYGEAITQKAYYIASAADKVYCNPQGGVDWIGLAASLVYFKDLLNKLEIEPQIFYAGKFKSATEPFREDHMTEANRQQLTALFNDMVQEMNTAVGASRKIEPAILKNIQDSALLQTANDALRYRLVDGLRYDDEVKAEIGRQVNAAPDKIAFLSLDKYSESASFKKTGGENKIAIIYANGDITEGKGSNESIGSEKYRNLLLKARNDKSIKAIVFRVNSPGGSALASEVIWREISLTKQVKPVVVSMGDYAASGGYYISCNADSVFADNNTLTGSIGVFSMLFNVERFFQHKLSINFDGVRTSPYADAGSGIRAMTATEKRLFQNSIDTIYHTFKTRVSNGRKIDLVTVDSIAQGRVWSGTMSRQLHLTDRKGGLKEALACAARMAKLNDYGVREYPEAKNNPFLNLLTSGGSDKDEEARLIREHVGEKAAGMLKDFKKVESMINTPQARLPFSLME